MKFDDGIMLHIFPLYRLLLSTMCREINRVLINAPVNVLGKTTMLFMRCKSEANEDELSRLESIEISFMFVFVASLSKLCCVLVETTDGKLENVRKSFELI
jgi:hypothetical protein